MSGPIDFSRLSSAISEWISEKVTGASRTGIVVGLSGGIDSAVAAALACRGLGPENVLGLIMPCESSPEDTRDGIRIAEHLGIPFRVIDLSPVLTEFLHAGELDRSDVLGVANVKARLRMTMLYASSDERLVLGTSNYSEILVGYWTKWGDGAADILPIGRLYKDEVMELAAWLGLPEWILQRVPSAGLWPGQSDEEEMGVTYDDIRAYFQGSDVSDAATDTIGRLVSSSKHKRERIPFFSAREWMEENV